MWPLLTLTVFVVLAYAAASAVARLCKDKTAPAASLGLMRMVVGLVAMAESLFLFWNRHLVYDDIPYLQAAEFDIKWLLAIWFLAGAFLFVGLGTRVAALVNYLCVVMTLGSFHLWEYHFDFTVIAASAFMVVAPGSSALSLDNLRRRLGSKDGAWVPSRVMPTIWRELGIVIPLGLVYLGSVMHKAESAVAWGGGRGVWAPTTLPHVAWHELPQFLDVQGLLMFLSYLTLIFELVFIFVVWFRKLHLGLIAIGVGLHVGIGYLFPIPIFGFGSAAVYVILIPMGVFELARRRLRHDAPVGVLAYDPRDDEARAFAAVIGHFDVRGAVDLQAQPDSDDPVTFTAGSGTPRVGRAGLEAAIGTSFVLRPLRGALLSASGRRFVRGLLRLSTTPPADPDAVARTGTRVAVAMAGLYAFLQLIVMFHAKITETTLRDAGMGGYWERVDEATRPITKGTIALTGVTYHDIFSDQALLGYNHIVAVVYVAPDGVETWLPMCSPEGRPVGLQQTGRVWAAWTFRYGGVNVDPDRVAEGIERYTAYWAHRNGVGTTDARYLVRVKKIDTPSAYEPGMLARQKASPWIDVGWARWTRGEFAAQIDDIESL